ncbi:MAG: response regulator [Anaerolineae bacterium]|nr:response regulator [Anaerolineae bacterium]
MEKPRPPILIVDDRPENLFALEKILRQLDIEIIQTTSGMEALALTLEHHFFVAIVDVQMPEMDGYELVELLRGNPRTASLPVIFVSAIYSDEYHHRRGYDAGAVDFLSKPFMPEILLSKVKVFLELYHQRRQLEIANLKLAGFARQLETSARVSQQITSILDLNELLAEVAELIRIGFDSYFVGVWLLVPDRKVIKLNAWGQSPNVPRLVCEYEIPLESEKSIIAQVCRSGTLYLANDVTADPVYLPNENLPDTASELVIPLNVKTCLLGVLDIQSAQTGVLTPETVSALHILADQIAIAIRNARLYADIRQFNTELENRVRERTIELEKAYTQLELLDRNKSEFIQIISHELRTPLTLVKGFSQILSREKQLQEDPEYQIQVQGILNGANRMAEIVNSMLDIVKIDNSVLDLSPKWLDLHELLMSLCNELAEPVAKRQLTLDLHPLTELPQIYADQDALYKVFSNLLYNAIKYTPNGGRITISGFFYTSDKNDLANDLVEIIVSDTGIGIDPQVQELIFTKFYQTGSVTLHSSGRTKFKGGGAGLGLAIARGIVEAHGGRIQVESPGYDESTCPGSDFHVFLPVEPKLLSSREITTQIAELRAHALSQ